MNFIKNILEKLEADLLSDTEHDGGFLKPTDAKRMKVGELEKSGQNINIEIKFNPIREKS
ncbi:MAG: hypothetical protein B7Y48_03980 [Methylophilales bacterium 28-44-11]|nr:MAG: hypothetical protein B7Y48_03980 [Methylophilales bacterium 28-44-11]